MRIARSVRTPISLRALRPRYKDRAVCGTVIRWDRRAEPELRS
jgi:hypothetical protein